MTGGSRVARLDSSAVRLRAQARRLYAGRRRARQLGYDAHFLFRLRSEEERRMFTKRALLKFAASWWPFTAIRNSGASSWGLQMATTGQHEFAMREQLRSSSVEFRKDVIEVANGV